jgi:transposase
MKKSIRYVGLDVHGETIAIAVAEAGRGGEVRWIGTIANRAEALRKAMKKLGRAEDLRVCYEAGPCGYAVYWQLTKLGIACEVIAPTLIPTKAGDRVKTDRRDAEKLARSYRSGDLTPVWVPDEAHESLRDLVRAREAAKKDEKRARHRLSKFFLRRGLRPPRGVRSWTQRYFAWVRALRMEDFAAQMTLEDYLREVDHGLDRVRNIERVIDEALEQASPQTQELVAALQALRGVAKVSAVTLATEVGQMSRFKRPCELMSYAGLVPSEYSSGSKTSRGSITKAGNSHLRRIVIESAWSYRHRPYVGLGLRKRQEGLAPEIKDVAWKAQHRLHERYRHLCAREKVKGKVVTAVGRELLGFIWAIGVAVERSTGHAPARAA